MKCGHCDDPITKKQPAKVCPMKETNPADHMHAVCARCFGRMTSDAPLEPAQDTPKPRT